MAFQGRRFVGMYNVAFQGRRWCEDGLGRPSYRKFTASAPILISLAKSPKLESPFARLFLQAIHPTQTITLVKAMILD